MTIPDNDVEVQQPFYIKPVLPDVTTTINPIKISQHNKNAQVINVKDFGAIGDGTYYPVADWSNSAKPNYRQLSWLDIKNAFPFIESSVDSIDWVAIQAASLVCKEIGATLYFPPGKYVINRTLFCYSVWEGAGTENAWLGNGLGTILLTYGAGNSRKWTDITGSDTANFTPLVVMGSSDTELRNMTLKTSTSPWSAGVFVPSTRRNRFVNVDVRGPFSAGGLYIDATWSKNNSPVPATDIRYTSVQADDGANEISVLDCFLEGLWGLVVQGTTRNPDNYSNPDDWIWAPGGTSDLSVIGSRLSCSSAIDVETRKLDGGSYKHNAAIKNGAKAGQGHNFVNCSFRTKSKYMIRLDRSNRDTFVNSYGETVGSNDTGALAEFAITSNTGEVSLVNDKINAPVSLNGVQIASTLRNINWQHNARISVFNVSGDVITPNITANANAPVPVHLTSFDAESSFTFNAYDAANYVKKPYMALSNNGTLSSPVYQTSFDVNGTFIYNAYDAVSQAKVPYLLVSNGVVRPTTPSTLTLGSSNYPFSRLRVDDVNINGGLTMGSTSASPSITTGMGSPEGVVTARVGSVYLRADGGTGVAFYVKEAGTGNTGWIAK